MKVELTKEEFANKISKALSALVSSDDISNYSFDKNTRSIQILIGEWCLELNANGTWDIA